jgi:uncharacterized protein with ParB-like and HNH nuclease domain
LSTGHSIDGIVLRIPEYQRPYKWTAKNVNQLLDDIMYAQNNNKEVYRVGTLILHKVVNDTETFYDIVDGQQRTITFSLLLHALIEASGEKKDIPFIFNENPELVKQFNGFTYYENTISFGGFYNENRNYCT